MARNGRVLLMDLDGTIADTVPHLCRSFRHAVAPWVHRPPTDAEIVASFGPPEGENIRQLLSNPAIGKAGGLDHIPDAVRRFHEYYEGRHGDIEPFSGIVEVIEGAIQTGWRFGVFTGKSRRSAIFALQQFGLWSRVECLVSGTDVERPKPHPEGVLKAADSLGSTPAHIVLVGDSPGDVQAGRSAGARTAAALWGAFDPDATRRARPHWVCPQVADLRGVLEVAFV